MKAVAVTPGKGGSLKLLETAPPTPGANEVLLRVLKVGVCGTDRDIVAGFYGTPPQGSTELIIGHESLCRVEDLGEDVSGFKEGELVVPTVRRNCPENCQNCSNGQSDMCLTGNYREHGIKLLHGFAREFATTDSTFVAAVDESLSDVGVLLEPLSIAEKGIEQAFAVQSQRMKWNPTEAIVLGAGAVGILATCILRLKGLEVRTVATRPQESVKARLVLQTGAEYVNAKETPIASLEDSYDLLVEATGNTDVALQAQDLIRPAGVASYLGIYRDKILSEDAGKVFTALVLGNRVHLGSVNANKRYFVIGAEDLVKGRAKWPGLFESMITRRVPSESALEAYGSEGEDDLKTVVEFQS